MHATPPRRTACSAATSTGRSPSRSRPRNREWHSTSVAARARTRFGLARAGWEVTALDISTVAVERGSAAAEAASVSVRWVAGDFAAEDLGHFDLLSAHYPALKHTPDRAVLRALVAAVASGGTLLYVGHAPLEREFSLARGFDPNDYVLPSDVEAFLDDAWEIEVAEQRPRPGGAPHESPFTHDDILRARRLR